MGDCRIRFQVSKSLLRHLAESRENDGKEHEDKERPHSIRSVVGGESSMSTAGTTTNHEDGGHSACLNKNNVPLTGHMSLDDPSSTRSDAPVLVEAKNYASDATVRELVEMLSIPSSPLFLEVVLGVAVPSAGGNDPLFPPVGGGGAPVPVLELLESQKAKLWDCTIYPPVDITSWPLELYTDRQGRKSRTLFDAGWFPGGTLLLLPYEQLSPITTTTAGNDDRYDDPQYNNTTQSTNASASSQRVHLQGSSAVSARPLPSQVLSSVSDRFASDAIDQDEARNVEEAARMERRHNQRRKRAAMEERLSKLDSRIRTLDEVTDEKNKKVSEQVQRMLIKSRATGRTDLKVQDRFYLRFVVDDRTSAPTEQFRYVSRQDTVGRILSSFVSPTTQSASSELLVLHPSSSPHAARYRRLPVLRRVYELVSDGHLAEFDRIVVRFYDPASEDGPTPSIDGVDGDDVDGGNDDPDHNDDIAEPFSKDSMVRLASSANSSHEEGGAPATATDVTQPASLPPPDDDRLHRRLREAIAAYNSGDGSSVRRKGAPGGAASGKSTTSTTSVKVRHMQMKSRATGDKNRVKMEDRFYVDLLIVVDEAGDSDGGPSMRVLNASPVFLSKSDPLQRLVRDFVRTSKGAAALPEQVDLFVATGTVDANSGAASFRRVDDTHATFLDAERDEVIHSFDRVVAYVHQ